MAKYILLLFGIDQTYALQNLCYDNFLLYDVFKYRDINQLMHFRSEVILHSSISKNSYLGLQISFEIIITINIAAATTTKAATTSNKPHPH